MTIKQRFTGKRLHSNIPLAWLDYPDWQAGYMRYFAASRAKTTSESKNDCSIVFIFTSFKLVSITGTSMTQHSTSDDGLSSADFMAAEEQPAE